MAESDSWTKFNQSRDFEEVLTTLRFLGKVQQNQKVNFNPLHVVSAMSVVGAVTRYYHNESRDTTLLALNNLLEEVEKFHSQDLTVEQQQHLKADLTVALRGIVNISTTYSADALFLSRFEGFMRRANNLLSRMG